MDPHTQLLQRVERYLKRTGIPATAFGYALLNNTALVLRLRTGNVTSKTMKRVSDHLDKQEKKLDKMAAR